MDRRVQPKWNIPVNSTNCQLKLYNSLTREKEVFVPQSGNKVSWYSCGPTVYDAAHMGHARSYISFDILRRVLSNYFGYDVFYVMNITDIDDKIIKRARQTYLFDQYKNEVSSNTDSVKSDIRKALKHYEALITAAEEVEKMEMLNRIWNNTSEALANVESQPESYTQNLEELINSSKDVLSEFLDSNKGKDVNDNLIFSELPRKFEKDFFDDMDHLNVLRPDVLTRVSEYIDEIIQYIQKIVENGLAYESNGSVYFDTIKFNESDRHFYAKLVPEAFGDLKKLQEGEGDLSISSDRLQEKKNPSDFALWKASKPGEPSWESSWGKGRPGWHIECSVMASDILGDSLDIHTGGYDLKFPHHDNELAQAEAYFDNDHWVKYFLHSGHLTIQGSKMSKSLKNFITIKDALDYHTARQIRLAFLLHSWKDTLDYSPQTLDNALHYERLVREFLHNIKDTLQNVSPEHSSFNKWSEGEKNLANVFQVKKDLVHQALCDNIDTRSALESMQDLIKRTNVYIHNQKKNQHTLDHNLLSQIRTYVLRILNVFGADFSKPSQSEDVGDKLDFERRLEPYMKVTSEFRDEVRKRAIEIKDPVILKLCDGFRDDVLPELGILLEDREGEKTKIKYVDPQAYAEEKKKQQKLLEERRKAKEEAKLKLEQQKAEKESLKKIPPADMFKNMSDKYTKFDEKGLPTHDSEGKELTETQRKKLRKLYDNQDKKYKSYLQSIAAS